LDVWSHIDYYTYALLDSEASAAAIERKLPRLVEAHSDSSPYSPKNQNVRYFLQPLTRIHLDSRFGQEISVGGDAFLVGLFGAIGVLVLLLACFNHINLTTARAARRRREVEIRKTIGARPSDLIRQFLGETFATTALSTTAAVVLARGLLPVFEHLSGKPIPLAYPFPAPLVYAALILVTGFLSGLYPAFYLASVPAGVPSRTGASSERPRGLRLRSVLVVGQFVVFIGLTICTWTVQRQLHLVRTKPLGFDRDHVVLLSIPDRRLSRPLVSELTADASIIDAATSQHPPSRITTNNFPNWSGKPQDLQVSCWYNEIDERFIDFYRMPLVEGEVSRERFSAANLRAYLNESAAAAFGWKQAVGRTFEFLGDTWTVAGIVKDFHSAPLREPISPVILLKVVSGNTVSVRLDGRRVAAGLAHIERVWKKHIPGFPFRYSFLDEEIDRVYGSEQTTGRLYLTFTLLAILITSLGLFGLSLFSAEQRKREIAVRKVLGASIPEIFRLLSTRFAVWVLAANLIAWPAAYAIMTRWLNGFAYRIKLDFGIFILSAAIAGIIAIFVVGSQTLKAAMAHPVASIKDE